MTFYSYQFIVSNQNQGQYLRIAIICALVVVTLLLMLQYLRHRWDVKFKDLAVIAGTFLMLTLAYQYNDFTNLQASSKQNGQIIATVKQVAHQLNVKPQTLAVNNPSQANTGLLVKSANHYYNVVYNADGSEFVLQRVSLVKTRITVKGV